jgi:hypothetical protein
MDMHQSGKRFNLLSWLVTDLIDLAEVAKVVNLVNLVKAQN